MNFRALGVFVAGVAAAGCGNSREQVESSGAGASQGGSGSAGAPIGGSSSGSGGVGGRVGDGGAGVGGGHSGAGGSAGAAGTAGTAGSAGSAGGAAGSAGAMLSQHEACVEYTRVVCNRMYNDCEGSPTDDEPCEDTTDWCPDLFFSEGSNTTVADVIACIAAWKATSCDDISRSYFPDCGLPPGDVAAGAPCAFSTQCATHRCGNWGTDEAHPDCGVCIERPVAAGDPCETSELCPMDTTCADGICAATYVSNQPAGAVCTRFGQCVAGYLCFDTEDGSEMRCQPIPSEGEPCDRINVCTLGLFCSESGCAPAAVAGEPCSVAEPIPTLTSQQYICAPDAVCDKAATGGPTCVPRGAPGQPCIPVTEATDPRATCLTGLQCACDDDSCATGHCSLRRYAGESCAEVGARCVAGSTCVDGACEDTGLQGYATKACGAL